ncbi:MAG: RND family transporter, partial [Gammaproteobacteria bacterium]
MIGSLDRFIFSHRVLVVSVFAAVTGGLGYCALALRIDAGFGKLLPLNHGYIQTFTQYQHEFGGANRILVALAVKNGDIFTAEFFDTLRAVTDAVFFLPGVDRAQLSSLFTANVRYTEVVEDGIAGGNVIPSDFRPDPEGFARVRRNIQKAGLLGRLVANDFSGALVSAQLMEIDPESGQRLDYVEVAERLETDIRARFGALHPNLEIHIIGFAKMVGDIAAGARHAAVFFGLSFAITALLVYRYAHSVALTLVTLGSSVIAVVWQLGLLALLGYGI